MLHSSVFERFGGASLCQEKTRGYFPAKIIPVVCACHKGMVVVPFSSEGAHLNWFPPFYGDRLDFLKLNMISRINENFSVFFLKESADLRG